jgi:hypothetical protein
MLEEEAMRNLRRFYVWSVAVVTAAVLWAGLVATAATKPETNANAAFSRLKALAGSWEAQSERGTVSSSYELISNATALVEHIKVPGEQEMMTVYYLDGNRLLLTHYCTAGNQPQMQAEAYDPAGNQLVFNFIGGGNLSDPGKGHMHNVVLQFLGADSFSSKWTFQENGKPKFAENMEFHRVK